MGKEFLISPMLPSSRGGPGRIQIRGSEGGLKTMREAEGNKTADLLEKRLGKGFN